MADNTEDLLRALLATTGRAAFSPIQLYDLVAPNGNAPKQIKAFNLADGTRTQADIAKQAGIDPASFSRSVSRWIENGIMFRLGKGRDSTLLHIYPVPTKRPKD